MKKKDIYINYKKEIVSLRKDIIYDFNRLNNVDKVSLKYKVEPKTPLEKNIKSFVDNFIKLRLDEGMELKEAKEIALTIVKFSLLNEKQIQEELAHEEKRNRFSISKIVWITLIVFIIGMIITLITIL
ncbi:MAG: hypothetical protein ACI311_06530 [Bacilli bacterium]